MVNLTSLDELFGIDPLFEPVLWCTALAQVLLRFFPMRTATFRALSYVPLLLL
jgi:hypothetical protein